MNMINIGDTVRLKDDINLLEEYGLEAEKERDMNYIVEEEQPQFLSFPNKKCFLLDDKDGLIYPEDILIKIDNNE